MTPSSKKKRASASAASQNLASQLDDDSTESSYVGSTTKRKSSRKASSSRSSSKKSSSNSITSRDDYNPKSKSSSCSTPTAEHVKSKIHSVNDEPKPKKSKSLRTQSAVVGPVKFVDHDNLILVSDKRRGIYECDYCRRDISQVPRIRCAICPDFDACLECFPRVTARAKKEEDTDDKKNASATSEEFSHGYRVADSTRFPLFPSPQQESSITSLSYKPDDKIWTAEEDLRLLDAISSLGLGNWVDIADSVGNSKNPRRCMERYFDDFLGRYGYILPKYTWVEVNEDDEEVNNDQDDMQADESSVTSSWSASSKRKKKSRIDHSAVKARKFNRVLTESLPNYKNLTDPFLPQGKNVEDDVNRDVRYRIEQSFVKAIANASSKSEADKIATEFKTNNTEHLKVFPPRLEDIRSLPGSELAGYMPRRGDFDFEWDNDAESILADMEFSNQDHPNERALKVEILKIYNSKLDERERRKKFIQDRNLLNYRQIQQREEALPKDERELVHRLRLFARFHSAEEHELLIANLLKAKKIQKEIAQLQFYANMGLTTLSDVEKYEIDKESREFHKNQSAKKKTEETADSTTDEKKIQLTPPSKPHTPMLKPEPFSSMEGYHLLSSKEVDLCKSLDIVPKVYLQIKRILIQQSLQNGLLENDDPKKQIFLKLDIEKQNKIVDFVFRAGWIRTKHIIVD